MNEAIAMLRQMLLNDSGLKFSRERKVIALPWWAYPAWG